MVFTLGKEASTVDRSGKIMAPRISQVILLSEFFWQMDSQEFFSCGLQPLETKQMQHENNVKILANMFSAKFKKLFGISLSRFEKRHFYQRLRQRQIELNLKCYVFIFVQSRLLFFNYRVCETPTLSMILKFIDGKIS